VNNSSKILVATFAVLALFIAGCTSTVQDSEDTSGVVVQEPEVSGQEDVADVAEDKEPSQVGWRDVEFTDIATGKSFRISDFKGTPVLLESFAVWCPTCLQQQFKIKELLESEGDVIIHVSLDTDPNEDEARVKAHFERNGLDWLFAVSPVEATRSLIDEFGIGVVNAPRAPVVLVCADQSARLLRGGVKSASELKDEVDKGC